MLGTLYDKIVLQKKYVSYIRLYVPANVTAFKYAVYYIIYESESYCTSRIWGAGMGDWSTSKHGNEAAIGA